MKKNYNRDLILRETWGIGYTTLDDAPSPPLQEDADALVADLNVLFGYGPAATTGKE